MRLQRCLTLLAILLVTLTLAGRRGEAHKPITSPYTYNENVFPIVRDRCGRCHVAGGVAPMSLMTYKDAVPWGESIRTELIAGHMPPGGVDESHGRFKNAQTLSARDLNILLTWVTGGTPVGNAEHTPPFVALGTAWRLGTPDLVLPFPSSVTLGADTVERVEEFSVPTGTTEARWVRAVDILPGTAAMVRSATISVKSSVPPDSDRDGTTSERMLGLWVPGEDPVSLDEAGAFRLPAGAELVVRVHYKKTWEYERTAMTDRSTVGIYFATRGMKELRALTMAPAATVSVAQDLRVAQDFSPALPQRLSFNHVVEEDLQALAVYPDAGLANVGVRMEAVRADGSRVDLIRFHPQPDWARRYWFEHPIPLPRGSRIEVVATFDDTLLPPGAAPPKRADLSALRLTLNVVSTR